MQSPLVIPFAHCAVHVYYEDYLETIFPDGRKCPALFSFGPDAQNLAQHLGYGLTVQGIRCMHFDHELGHTFLAEREGQPHSPVLRGVADPIERPDDAARAREEHRVLAFQRRLNGTDSDRDVYLQRFGTLRPLVRKTEAG